MDPCAIRLGAGASPASKASIDSRIVVLAKVLWLAFVGWLLVYASRRSPREALVPDDLEGARVKDLMRPHGHVFPPDTPVGAVVRDGFLRYGEHAFPVIEDERLVGVVCMGDVRKISEIDWARTPVTAIMTPADRLVLATGDGDASSARSELARLDVEQLPVVEQGILVGFLERRDIARWIELRHDLRWAQPPRPAVKGRPSAAPSDREALPARTDDRWFGRCFAEPACASPRPSLPEPSLLSLAGRATRALR